MKRWMSDSSETTTLKVQSDFLSLSEIPPEVFEIIVPYLDKPSLASFIQTSHVAYQAFKTLYSDSMDHLRLKYLNQIYYGSSRLLNPWKYTKFLPKTFPKDMETFQSIFNKIYNMNDSAWIGKYVIEEAFKLNLLHSQKFVIAGGAPFIAINSNLLGPQEKRSARIQFQKKAFQDFLSSDIDIFLIENGKSPEESEDLIHLLFQNVEDRIKNLKMDEYMLVRFQLNTLNIVCNNSARKDVQFILRRISTIEELLVFFDLDCVRFALDGENLFTTYEGIRALNHSRNYVPKAQIENGMYSKRAMKYGERGIKTLFLDLHPLNFLHDLSAKLDLRGSEYDFYSENTAYDIREDDEMYSILPRLSFEMLTKIYQGGLDSLTDFIEHDFGEVAIKDMSALLKKEQFTIAKSFSELMYMNGSRFFKDRYRDNHLLKKYHIGKCYLCQKYRNVNPEKHEAMCITCRGENLKMRSVDRSLKGYVAVVTGARIKIGFAVALRLLRSGAKVIGTTRFTVDALERFQKEKDYDVWKENLDLYSLNLIGCDTIIKFADYVKEKYARIHILINNAAQTVRRPFYLYKQLIEKEEKSSSESSKLALTLLKQDLIPEDEEPKKTSIKIDQYGEPFNKREKNTWKKNLEEVSQRELLEVQLINNIAPTILLQQLAPIMKVTRQDLKSSFVINVTSHEGQFFTNGKTDHHIHNNMSKSALNMLTRSCAEFYAQNGIRMNSVDTGWISSSIDTFIQPPLQCEDGAARILHPIYTQSKNYGQLLKNYQNTPW